jgi:hypothetical protein
MRMRVLTRALRCPDIESLLIHDLVREHNTQNLETVGYSAPNESLRGPWRRIRWGANAVAVLAHTVPFSIADDVQEVYEFTSQDLEAVLLEAKQFRATLVTHSRFLLVRTSGHEIQAGISPAGPTRAGG